MQQRENRINVNDFSVQLKKAAGELPLKPYRVFNISRGGLCFECTKDEFELNEIINLDLSRNKKSIHQASGRICYCNESDSQNTAQYGLSFLDKFIDPGLLC